MSLEAVKKEFPRADTDLIHSLFHVFQKADDRVFKPGFLSTLVRFIRDNGFPTTIGGAQAGGLSFEGFTAVDMLKILVDSKIVTKSELAGKLVKNIVKRDGEENALISKNPDSKVEVYYLAPDFVKELSSISKQLKLGFSSKGEGVSECINEAKMELAKLNRKLSHRLDENHDEDENISEREKEFFKHMDEHHFEIMVESLLSSIAEFEMMGMIPKFEHTSDVRAALLAATRKMYQSRGVISKMASRFKRLGASRVLRRARGVINKTLRK